RPLVQADRTLARPRAGAGHGRSPVRAFRPAIRRRRRRGDARHRVLHARGRTRDASHGACLREVAARRRRRRAGRRDQVSEGPPRDLVGYGRTPPQIAWPDGALVAINLVLIYEEGSERTVVEGDTVNDGWGEYEPAAEPPVRDLGTETHYEYGSRVGI